MNLVRHFFGLTLVVFLFFGGSSAYALRCGNEIIDVGESPAKVLRYCGQPANKIKDRRYSKLSFAKSKNGHKQPKKLEKWVYNFGPMNLLYIITFEKGKIIAVDTDGFGY